MKHGFKLKLNNNIIFSYTEKPAPARLRRFLDEMDNDMHSGIQLGELWVEEPSEFQRLQYVAMKLFDAVEKNNLNDAEVMAAYLIDRNQKLNEILITLKDELFNLKLK